MSESVGKDKKEGTLPLIKFSHLSEYFKCENCRKYPSAQAFVCSGGHVSCHNCFKHNPSCSLCDQPMTFDAWASSVVKNYAVPCQYPGCTQELSMGNMNSHLYSCEFQTSECFEEITDSEGNLRPCGKVMLFKDLFDHLREAHNYG